MRVGEENDGERRRSATSRQNGRSYDAVSTARAVLGWTLSDALRGHGQGWPRWRRAPRVDLYERDDPREARPGGGGCNDEGVRLRQGGVGDEAGEDEGDAAVEHDADADGCEHCGRHVLDRVEGLLGGGGDGVEADEGECGQAGGAEDAGPAEMAKRHLWGDEWVPVVGIDKHTAEEHE